MNQTIKPKSNKNNKNKNEKKKSSNEFEFCKVCNRNHEEGNRHKYFPSHKASLSNYLSRFQTKLSDLKFFVKNPAFPRPDHVSRDRLWCVFCDCDVHETPESIFACENLINHMASADHLKKLKYFMWKYGGGMDRVDAFRLSEAVLAKWEKKCEALKNEPAVSNDGPSELKIGPSNDIRNGLNHEYGHKYENNDINMLNSNYFNDVMPLQYNTNEYQISHSGASAVPKVGPFVHGSVCSTVNSNGLTGHWIGQQSLLRNSEASSLHYLNGGGGTNMAMGLNCSRGLQSISEIPTAAPTTAVGNVHTGAPPPWFEPNMENQIDIHQKAVSFTGASLSDTVGKSRKLNPKRVGAAWAERRKIELEMEKRGEIPKMDSDADWLPNFGRVWQSGSRKESRKEFETEKQKLPKAETHKETPMTLSPYISKRMRRDAGNIGLGDYHANG